MKIFFKEKIDIYDRPFYICFDLPSFHKIIDMEGCELDFNPEDLESLSGFVLDSKGLHILYIADKNDYNSIAHESFHLACNINEYVGIQYEAYGHNEAFAYLVGYLTELVLKRQREYFKTIKSKSKREV